MDFKKYLGLIENFISLSLFKLVDSIIPLVIIPYLILKVGSENYGIYAFAYALIFYLLNIVQYGFSLYSVRLLAVNKDDKTKINTIYSNSFTTQLYLTVLVLVVLFLLIVFVDKFNDNYLVYCFFSLIILGELFCPIWFFMGIEKMRFITIINLLSKSTFAILVFLFINEKSDFIYISLYQSVGFIISGIFAQFIIFRKFKIKLKIAAFYEVVFILKDGLSAFLTMVTPTLYTNTSVFLVGVFGLPQYVSFIEIGSKVSGAFSVLNTVLTQALYPFINRNKAMMKKFQVLFVFFGLVFSFLMYSTSEFLIGFWLPGPSQEIIIVVKYLSPCPFLVSIISAYGVNGLMVFKKDILYLKIVAIGSVIGMIVGLILIPNYFYIGGAIAIVTALSVKAILSFLAGRKLSYTIINNNEF